MSALLELPAPTEEEMPTYPEAFVFAIELAPPEVND
jgi:hypothetical protein